MGHQMKICTQSVELRFYFKFCNNIFNSKSSKKVGNKFIKNCLHQYLKMEGLDGFYFHPYILVIPSIIFLVWNVDAKNFI